MYRQQLNRRDRALSLAAVVLIHAGLALAVLNFAGVEVVPSKETLTQLIPIGAEPPPPPEVEIPVEDAAPEKEGAASAKNIKSEATPVEAPKPKIVTPSPNPIVASATPKTGSEATQGASNVVGPGTGAGGQGTGTGAGGSGSGTGGGGTGQGTRPTLATRGLTLRDYPPAIAERAPRRGAVFAIVHVAADGRPDGCRIDRSSGDRSVDDWTCSLILSRVRFNPSRDGNGRPVPAYYGYIQEFRTR
jgi:protein TonB